LETVGELSLWKTIENILIQKNVKITTSEAAFIAAVKRPGYERHIIVNENICIVLTTPEGKKVRRPFYIGFSILEISKLIMYDFFTTVSNHILVKKELPVFTQIQTVWQSW